VRAHGRSKRRMNNHRRKNAAFFASGVILIFPAAIAIMHYVIR
jgi:hypothetical protein